MRFGLLTLGPIPSLNVPLFPHHDFSARCPNLFTHWPPSLHETPQLPTSSARTIPGPRLHLLTNCDHPASPRDSPRSLDLHLTSPPKASPLPPAPTTYSTYTVCANLGPHLGSLGHSSPFTLKPPFAPLPSQPSPTHPHCGGGTTCPPQEAFLSLLAPPYCQNDRRAQVISLQCKPPCPLAPTHPPLLP